MSWLLAFKGTPTQGGEGTRLTMSVSGPFDENELSVALRVLQERARPDGAWIFDRAPNLARVAEVVQRGGAIGEAPGARKLVIFDYVLPGAST